MSDDVVTLHAHATSEHPDGTVVERRALPLGSAPGSRVLRLRMRSDNRQVLSVQVYEKRVAEAPGLVYVERIDRTSIPVIAELVAFLHADAAAGTAGAGLPEVPAGTFLTLRDAHRAGLGSSAQVGAVRWNPATGQALEIYVAPAHRRRRIATTLFFAAEACAVARDWPRLWAGGVRTALGEAVYRRWRWGVRRAHPLTSLAPPMTPSDEGAGIPARHLVPDGAAVSVRTR